MKRSSRTRGVYCIRFHVDLVTGEVKTFPYTSFFLQIMTVANCKRMHPEETLILMKGVCQQSISIQYQLEISYWSGLSSFFSYAGASWNAFSSTSLSYYKKCTEMLVSIHRYQTIARIQRTYLTAYESHYEGEWRMRE